MGTSADLKVYLQGIADLVGGSVYYQPPPSVSLSYPCIIYERDVIRAEHADNKPYLHRTRYKVTLIDRDPDSGMIPSIVDTESASFSTHFTKDNLYHDIFTLYF